MARYIFKICMLSIVFLLMSGSSSGQISGREIMVMVDGRDDGNDARSESTMRLINKKGQERVRKVARLTKDYGDDVKSLIIFLEPADIRGTGLLMFDYGDVDRDDDQWLYLPAFKKVRRIAASKKSDSFMGTDFTYDDMGDREVDKDTHNLLGEETVDGFDCWVVESIPTEKRYQYSKKISWIIKDRKMPLKVDYYDRHGNLLKQMHHSGFEQIDGIWTAMRMEMHNVQNNHRTVIEIKNVSYNSGLKDSYFTERTLKKGRIN